MQYDCLWFKINEKFFISWIDLLMYYRLHTIRLLLVILSNTTFENYGPSFSNDDFDINLFNQSIFQFSFQIIDADFQCM